MNTVKSEEVEITFPGKNKTDVTFLNDLAWTPYTSVNLSLENHMLTYLHSNSFIQPVLAENLVKLNLSHNRIKSIDCDAFCQLLNLRSLDLSLNLIDKITVKLFESNVNLEKLILNNNAIKHVDDHAFVNLCNLKKLRLEFNALQQVTKRTFAVRESALDHLSLSNNQIASIDELSFQSLTKLKILNLAHNLMKTIRSPLFRGLETNLRVIKLNSNLIQKLPCEVFQNFKKLNNLALYDNDFPISYNFKFLKFSPNVLRVANKLTLQTVKEDACLRNEKQ
jgi:Leucine-rich repeat (LRR) protein